MPKLDIYNISKLGVNVDKAQPFLEDGELTQAQNAIRDGVGEDGGLRKRPGLVEYNSAAAAGSILGGIGVPLGSGPGVGAATTGYYVAMVASPYWRLSTDKFATSSTTTILAQTASYNTTNGLNASLSAMLRGRLYYMARTVADNRSIRVFDGVQDSLFTSIPSGYSFTQLATLKGYLYAAVAQGTTAAYVFRIDSVGRLTQIGAALPTAIVLFGDLEFHNNDLYVSGQESGAGVAGKVYRIRAASATTATAWTLDYTHPNASGTIITLASFAGLLYGSRTGTAGNTGAVLQRSSAGVYSVIDDYLSLSGRPKALIVFKNVLYAWATRYNGGSDLIRKTTDGTTWTTVFTASGSPSADMDVMLYTTGDTIFAIRRSTTFTLAGYWSTNGTTWTSFDFATSDNSQEAFGFIRQ